MSELKNKLGKLEKYKYPLLILAIGIAIMLFPSGKANDDVVHGDSRLEQVLSSVDGVGETQVMVSESGVIVVARGAENAKVRLDIIRAIGSYTGFGADKITVLKMADLK